LRRLLVPVDFSEPSFCALRGAIDLAEDIGARLTILYVVPADDSWLNIGREGFQDLEKSLQKQAAEELQALARTHVPINVRTDLEVRIGRPAEEIVKAASETDSDAIVLSTHGRTGLDRYLIGSVAERVTRLATRPVFLIPAKKKRQKRQSAEPAVLRMAALA
jgi:nucleotide-binding universal stress UspA family protein